MFDDSLDITLGGSGWSFSPWGQAHTPGDLFAWLPAQSVMFSGDIVYIGRMLGIMLHSNNRSWIETFNAMAGFSPSVIVPRIRAGLDAGQARADTLDYLDTARQDQHLHGGRPRHR